VDAVDDVRADWKPNRAISSEARLGDEFGLSRPTVRRAIAFLVDEGWLFVRQGRGTYAAERTPSAPADDSGDVSQSAWTRLVKGGSAPYTLMVEGRCVNAGQAGQ
jgi:DNA-binding GntR family transcriptional regulator